MHSITVGFELPRNGSRSQICGVLRYWRGVCREVNKGRYKCVIAIPVNEILLLSEHYWRMKSVLEVEISLNYCCYNNTSD